MVVVEGGGEGPLTAPGGNAGPIAARFCVAPVAGADELGAAPPLTALPPIAFCCRALTSLSFLSISSYRSS